MVGKKLVRGKDWADEVEVRAYPPNEESPFWEIVIPPGPWHGRMRILTSNAVVIYDHDNQVEEIYY